MSVARQIVVIQMPFTGTAMLVIITLSSTFNKDQFCFLVLDQLLCSSVIFNFYYKKIYMQGCVCFRFFPMPLITVQKAVPNTHRLSVSRDSCVYETNVLIQGLILDLILEKNRFSSAFPTGNINRVLATWE